MWKRFAVLAVVVLLPVPAIVHTKLFYRMSCRSDYREVEVMITPTPEMTLTPMPTDMPLVEIPLESTLTLEPMLTQIPTEAPIEVLTPTPEPTDQITTSTDLTTTPAELLQRRPTCRCSNT